MEATTLTSFLPLLLTTLILFFICRWIGMAFKVWTTPLMILSLIPIVNYISPLILIVKGVKSLMTRIEQLEKEKNIT